MKVLIVNTSEKIGGAAIAAKRLMNALSNNGAEVKMLVRDKQTNENTVIALGLNLRTKLQFVWERFVIWLNNKFRKEGLFSVSIANTGTDITKLQCFMDADIIHLHWINQGMLSLADINKIVKSGKPIVWTMHDMWNFTGVCHYADDCDKYKSHCNACPLIQSTTIKDISYRTFEKKRNIFINGKISFVTCSRWLKDKAAESALLQNCLLTNIPNAIDTNVFRKKDKNDIRNRLNLPEGKKILLFGSMKISDKRKGFDYLVEACRYLETHYPTFSSNIAVVVIGHNQHKENYKIPFPIFFMDYISNDNELCDVYNACDLYVTPSLQDNLPNTIMEAMACGLPCIGFDTGGIPEMIEHMKNGYISEYKSSEDFAKGIKWILTEAPYDELSENVRKKVLTEYSETVVAEKYFKIYNDIMNQ